MRAAQGDNRMHMLRPSLFSVLVRIPPFARRGDLFLKKLPAEFVRRSTRFSFLAGHRDRCANERPIFRNGQTWIHLLWRLLD